MFGRVVGVLAGLALVAFAVAVWRPELYAAGFEIDIGPFGDYRPETSGLIAAVGLVIAIAAVQRPRTPRRRAAAPPPSFIDAPGPALVLSDPVPPAAHPPAEPPAPKRPSSDRAGFVAATDAGDHFRLQGAYDDAMDHYDAALHNARDGLARHPDDPGAQADLAAALTNVGDVHDAQGRLDRALEAHEESLALRRALAEGSTDRQTLRSLSLGLERLADTRESRGHRSRALELYRQSLPIAERLAAAHPGDPVLAADLAATRTSIAALEAKLA
jgi:tetratricopeptide (TPR) repeat protein